MSELPGPSEQDLEMNPESLDDESTRIIEQIRQYWERAAVGDFAWKTIDSQFSSKRDRNLTRDGMDAIVMMRQDLSRDNESVNMCVETYRTIYENTVKEYELLIKRTSKGPSYIFGDPHWLQKSKNQRIKIELAGILVEILEKMRSDARSFLRPTQKPSQADELLRPAKNVPESDTDQLLHPLKRGRYLNISTFDQKFVLELAHGSNIARTSSQPGQTARIYFSIIRNLRWSCFNVGLRAVRSVAEK